MLRDEARVFDLQSRQYDRRGFFFRLPRPIEGVGAHASI